MTTLTKIPRTRLKELLQEPSDHEGFSNPPEGLVGEIKYAWGTNSSTYKGYKTHFKEKSKAESIVVMRAFFCRTQTRPTQAEIIANGGVLTERVPIITATLEMWLGEWCHMATMKVPQFLERNLNTCPFQTVLSQVSVVIYNEDHLYGEHEYYPHRIKKMFDCPRHGGFIPKKVVPELSSSTWMTESWNRL